MENNLGDPMAKINLSKLSVKELKALQTDAAKQIENRKKGDIKDVRKTVKKIIKDAGLTPADIFPALKAATSTVAPKYRNPDDPAQTWTGRGRKPKWMQAKIDSGSKPEDFAI
jgi:DNA-binding protein H-NS